MNGIEQAPGILLDEEEKQLGCQLLNKTNEVVDISAEFLEMEYLTLIPPEKAASSKRPVRNETLPPTEEAKQKKLTPPSLLYIMTLIIQQNPFSFNCSVWKKPSEFTESYYYIVNHCDDYQPR